MIILTKTSKSGGNWLRQAVKRRDLTFRASRRFSVGRVNDYKNFENRSQLSQGFYQFCVTVSSTSVTMMGSARFFITLFIAFQTFNHGFSDNSTLCNSDVCHKLSKYLYSLMNPVVNPCDNFYQFTCGGYLAANKQVPLGSDFIGVEDISSEIVYKAVLDGLHLVKSNSKKVSKAFKYAKRYFEHCTEYDPKDEGNQNEVVDYLLKFTKWPFTEKNWNEEDFDPVELVARLQAELQLPTLAEMKISQDKLDNEHMTVYLKEGALLYPVQRFNDSLFPEFREKYIDSIFKAFEQLAINAKVTHWNVKKFKKVAREIYEFESDLAKFIEPTDDESENDIFKFYNPLTMAQLNMIYNSSTVWQTYFKTTVGNDERTLKWLDENRIIVTQLRYFVSLADKLVNTKPEVVANYLMWRLLAYLGPYFDNEFMIIEGVPMSEDHSKNPKLKESVKKTPKELGDCLVETMKVFPYVAGRIYVDSRFSNSKLESSLNITQSIKDAVREMFSENTWLSKEAKRRIFEKLDNMVLNIGYPEWILNNTELNEHYKRHRIRSNGTSFFKNQLIMKRFKTDDLFETVNRHRFTLDVTEINNAQYNADMNALTVPAAQFEIPFFDPEYPDFHNFATVGFTVGHEIFHGFDTTGLSMLLN